MPLCYTKSESKWSSRYVSAGSSSARHLHHVRSTSPAKEHSTQLKLGPLLVCTHTFLERFRCREGLSDVQNQGSTLSPTSLQVRSDYKNPIAMNTSRLHILLPAQSHVLCMYCDASDTPLHTLEAAYSRSCKRCLACTLSMHPLSTDCSIEAWHLSTSDPAIRGHTVRAARSKGNGWVQDGQRLRIP